LSRFRFRLHEARCTGDPPVRRSDVTRTHVEVAEKNRRQGPAAPEMLEGHLEHALPCQGFREGAPAQSLLEPHVVREDAEILRSCLEPEGDHENRHESACLGFSCTASASLAVRLMSRRVPPEGPVRRPHQRVCRPLFLRAARADRSTWMRLPGSTPVGQALLHAKTRLHAATAFGAAARSSISPPRRASSSRHRCIAARAAGPMKGSSTGQAATHRPHSMQSSRRS